MKRQAFLSIVTPLQRSGQVRDLVQWLEWVAPVLEQGFTDYEIIVVNNALVKDLRQQLSGVSATLRPHLFLLHLASSAPFNHAILAGLDRANGDYTLILEPTFYEQPELIGALFEQTQQGYDIVYLRAAQARKLSALVRPFHCLFYFILRRFSDLKVDERAYDTRIISRRALNSLLRLRENLRYMKAIYSIVGYRTTALTLDRAMPPVQRDTFSDRFKTSLIAITSFTTFLRSLLWWIFVASILFLIGVVTNALLFKFTGRDLSGSSLEPVPGWTFLVIMLSIFFAITCLNLYIMSIYLTNIYQEIKQRPLYILESVERL